MTLTYPPRPVGLRSVGGIVIALAAVAGIAVLANSADRTDEARLPFVPAGDAPIATPTRPTPTVGFDTAHTWSDGASIVFGRPTPFSSPTAFAPTGLVRAVAVPIAVTAGTVPVQIGSLRFDATAAEQPAGAVFDRAAGIVPPTVAAGTAVRFSLLFAIPVDGLTPLAVRVDRAMPDGHEVVTVAGIT